MSYIQSGSKYIGINFKNIKNLKTKLQKDKKNIELFISWDKPDLEFISNNVNIYYEIDIDKFNNINLNDTKTKINIGHNNIKIKIRTIYEIHIFAPVWGIGSETLTAKSDWTDTISINGAKDEYCENIIKCKNILLNNSKNNKILNSNISSKIIYSQAVNNKSSAMTYTGNYNRCGFLGSIYR